MGPHQDTDDEHPYQAGKLEFAEDNIRRQAQNYDQRQAYCHSFPPRNRRSEIDALR